MHAQWLAGMCHTIWHMRTTVELPDDLLLLAKAQAAQAGITLREFFVAAVKEKLSPPVVKARRPPPQIGDPNGPPINPTREQIDEAMFG